MVVPVATTTHDLFRQVPVLPQARRWGCRSGELCGTYPRFVNGIVGAVVRGLAVRWGMAAAMVSGGHARQHHDQPAITRHHRVAAGFR